MIIMIFLLFQENLIARFYKNPVLDDSGDPDVLKDGDNYYLYLPKNKKNSDGGTYVVYKSRDLVNWKGKKVAFSLKGYSFTRLGKAQVLKAAKSRDTPDS